MTKDKLKKLESGKGKKQDCSVKITNDTFKYWFKSKFKIWHKFIILKKLLVFDKSKI